MTWLVDQQMELKQRRGPDIAPPSNWQGIGAAVQMEWQDVNMGLQRQRAIINERDSRALSAAERLGEAGLAPLISEFNQRAEAIGQTDRIIAPGTKPQDIIARLGSNGSQSVLDLARAAAAENPDTWSDLDLSDEGIEATVTERRKRELELNNEILLLSPAPVRNSILGSIVGAVVDPINLALAPLGAGGGSLLRVAGREALLGAASEAAQFPARQATAEELDKQAPDLLESLLLGAVGGAVLGAGIEVAPKIFRGLFYAGQARAQKFMEGIRPDVAEDAVGAGEQALAGNQNPLDAVMAVLEQNPQPETPAPAREPLIPRSVTADTPAPTPLAPDPVTTEVLPPRENEPPVPDGFVRLYHGGATKTDDTKLPNTFTTDRSLAEKYSANGRMFYVDVPKTADELEAMAINDFRTSLTRTLDPEKFGGLKEVARERPQTDGELAAMAEGAINQADPALSSPPVNFDAARFQPDPDNGKLPDTRGMGVRFHGSTSEITQVVDGYVGSDRNFYGQGFYTSDAVSITDGYSKAKGSTKGAVYRVDEVGPVTALDMEQPVPDWLVSDYRAIAGDSENDLILAAIEDMQAEGRPLNVREFYDLIRDISPEFGLPTYEVQEYFDTLSALIMKRGYNALDHVGGLRTNKSPHNVRIYLAPESTIRITKVDANNPIEAAPEPEVVRDNKPFLRRLKRGPGIDPNGELGKELKAMGVNARSYPGLFRKGGARDLDNLVASEWDELIPGISRVTGVADDGMYLRRDGVIQAIIDEAAGLRLKTDAEMAARSMDYTPPARTEIEDFTSGARAEDGLYFDPPSPFDEGDFRIFNERVGEARRTVGDYLFKRGIRDLLPDDLEEIARELAAYGGDAKFLIERAIYREVDEIKRAVEAPDGTGRAAGGENRGGERPPQEPAPAGAGPDTAGNRAGEPQGTVWQLSIPGTERTQTGDAQRLAAEAEVKRLQSKIRRLDQVRIEDDADSLFATKQLDIFDDVTSPQAAAFMDANLASMRSILDSEGDIPLGLLEADDGTSLNSLSDVLNEIEEMDNLAAEFAKCRKGGGNVPQAE